jgi:5-methylcytosine-specific restriction enzyme A
MTDFVVYHNTDKMGELDNSSYGIVTGHDVAKSEGQRIWLISGSERPRKYRLEQTFIVDEIGRAGPGNDYKFYARGKNGVTFDPPIEINNASWFQALRTATGNLAFGLQPIYGETVLGGLHQLLDNYSPDRTSVSWLDHPLTRVLYENYRRTGEEAGYWASYFLRELKKRGGLETAKRILAKPDGSGVTKGFIALDRAGLIELTVEAVALSPEFSHLFTPKELETAHRRLTKFSTSGWRPPGMFPDEVPEGATYLEGAVSRVLVNRYERVASAREACLRKHGTSCRVCGFSFPERYGEIGQNYIHVHHVQGIASLGKDYKIDPERDLVPVCPNCHAMLHTETPPMPIDKLKALLR